MTTSSTGVLTLEKLRECLDRMAQWEPPHYTDEEIARMCGEHVYKAYMKLIEPDKKR